MAQREKINTKRYNFSAFNYILSFTIPVIIFFKLFMLQLLINKEEITEHFCAKI